MVIATISLINAFQTAIFKTFICAYLKHIILQPETISVTV